MVFIWFVTPEYVILLSHSNWFTVFGESISRGDEKNLPVVLAGTYSGGSNLYAKPELLRRHRFKMAEFQNGGIMTSCILLKNKMKASRNSEYEKSKWKYQNIVLKSSCMLFENEASTHLKNILFKLHKNI